MVARRTSWAAIRALRWNLRAGDFWRELGTRLGGQVVSNGSAIKGVRCPKCGRASVSWWVALGTEIQARCNHKGSCGARFWLDELEAAT